MAEFTTSELYAIRAYLEEAYHYEYENADFVEGEDREGLIDSLTLCNELVAKITNLINKRKDRVR
jgi:hypothetical protein